MVVLETPVTGRGDLLFQRSDVFSSAALANRLRQASSRAKLHTRIPFKSSVPMHRAGDTHAAPVSSSCFDVLKFIECIMAPLKKGAIDPPVPPSHFEM